MKISIILPVFNEEKLIGETLKYLRETSPLQSMEIIVVDGGSSDHTMEAASPLADKLIHCNRKGRAVQMHQGALASTGDLLLFLHADTRLPQNWQTLMLHTWNGNSPRPAASAFLIKYDRSDWPYPLIQWSANVRSRWTGIPHGDQAITMLRETYFACGGFPEVPLMEEYLLFQQLRPFGSVRWLSSHVVTSSRRYASYGPLKAAIRNVLIVFLFYAGVSPQTLARYYK